MNRLRTWLGKQSASLSTRPGCSDEVTFSDTPGKHKRIIVTVTINSRIAYQTRLAVLLHECGHVAIFRARQKDPKRRVHGCTYREWWNSRGRCKKGSGARKLSTLDEELAAWEIGEKLGKRLGIRLARRTFERCRVKCLLTYVRDAQ